MGSGQVQPGSDEDLMLRYAAGKNHMVEFFAGGDFFNYHRKPLRPEEDRDSNAIRSYFSWYWSYVPDGLINLRYEYTDTDTDGDWWKNESHRFSL